MVIQPQTPSRLRNILEAMLSEAPLFQAYAQHYESAAADAAFNGPAAALCLPDERRIPTQDEDAEQEAPPQGFQMYAILASGSVASVDEAGVPALAKALNDKSGATGDHWNLLANDVTKAAAGSSVCCFVYVGKTTRTTPVRTAEHRAGRGGAPVVKLVLQDPDGQLQQVTCYDLVRPDEMLRIAELARVRLHVAAGVVEMFLAYAYGGLRSDAVRMPHNQHILPMNMKNTMGGFVSGTAPWEALCIRSLEGVLEENVDEAVTGNVQERAREWRKKNTLHGDACVDLLAQHPSLRVAAQSVAAKQNKAEDKVTCAR